MRWSSDGRQIEDAHGKKSVELALRRLPSLTVPDVGNCSNLGAPTNPVVVERLQCLSHISYLEAENHDVSLWDASTGELIQVLPLEDSLEYEHLSIVVPQSGRVLFCLDNEAKTSVVGSWRPRDPWAMLTLVAVPNSCGWSLSPNSQKVVTISHGLECSDVRVVHLLTLEHVVIPLGSHLDLGKPSLRWAPDNVWLSCTGSLEGAWALASPGLRQKLSLTCVDTVNELAVGCEGLEEMHMAAAYIAYHPHQWASDGAMLAGIAFARLARFARHNRPRWLASDIPCTMEDFVILRVDIP